MSSAIVAFCQYLSREPPGGVDNAMPTMTRTTFRHVAPASLSLLLALSAAIAVAPTTGCDYKVKSASRMDAGGLPQFLGAARHGDVAAVKQMLDDGVSPDLRDSDGVTALHRAARDERLDMMQVLLDANANTNLSTNTGWTPLQLAVKYRRKPSVELLLRYNANPDAKTPDGFLPLTAAIEAGDIEIVRLLMGKWPTWTIERIEHEDKTVELRTVTTGTHTVDVNAKDGKGITALWLAVKANNFALMGDLLNHSANIDEVVLDGRTVLHLAADRSTELIVKLLLDRNANLSIRDNKGMTPYAVAYARGDAAIAKLIWERGGR